MSIVFYRGGYQRDKQRVSKEISMVTSSLQHQKQIWMLQVDDSYEVQQFQGTAITSITRALRETVLPRNLHSAVIYEVDTQALMLWVLLRTWSETRCLWGLPPAGTPSAPRAPLPRGSSCTSPLRWRVDSPSLSPPVKTQGMTDHHATTYKI